MNIALAWLLTFALHACGLLAAALLIERAMPRLPNAWRELLWRTALFGALLTASAQLAVQHAPLSGRWTVSPAQVAVTAAAPLPEHMPVIAESRGAKPQATIEHAIDEDSVTHDAANTSAPTRWLPWLLALWCGGAALAMLRNGVLLWRCRRDLRTARAVDDVTLAVHVGTLAANAGTRVPRLLQLDDIGSPLALTHARIVLPAWAMTSLDTTQLRAMLAHELGHIVRRDPAVRLVVAFWCALLWWLPLARVAQRRLEETAELACDEFAARHTDDARGLAECLAACGEHLVYGPSPEFAPAMAVRASSLITRIERLLEGVTMEPQRSGFAARSLAFVALGLGALCLPAVGIDVVAAQTISAAPAPPAAPVAPASPAKPADSHSHINIIDESGRDRTTISQSDDQHKFRADIEGKIAFTDDESDVKMLDANGSATFEETRDGVKRRIEIEPKGGELRRRFFVDGTEQPWDDTARTWMKQVVLDLARSGIGAEERVKRLYREGGAARVLAEIGEIHSDYVRGIYLEALVGLGKLTPEQLDRTIALAGAMSTDYERHKALAAVFDKQALDAQRQLAFLRQALHFDTDYELAELLIGVLPRLSDTPELRQAWLDAGLKVKSDYERRRTLEAMVARSGLDDAQLASVVRASASMQSDYERRTLLTAVAQHAHDVDAFAPIYTQALQGLGSDYERREALLALIRSGKLGARGAAAVLDAAAHIGSSYECREVLVALAQAMPQDAALEARYREVAGKLGDYDRKEAERVLRR
jgi:beta-lactamase regulating signal transducer with metallopeptidase domain